MAATSQSLQEQVEQLDACCPVLCPDITPSGYDTDDLFGLMQSAGRESTNAFSSLLEDAARGVSSCCLCGAEGTPSTSGADADDEDGDDSDALHFTVLTAVDFKARSICLKRAGFACSQCRALRSTCRMVRFCGARVGAGNEAETRSQLLLALCAHLAATNRAPDELQGNPEALAVWVQELYCRAYALRVVASNLGGWSLVGADGRPVALSRPRDVVAAARALVQQQAKPAKGKAKAKAAAAQAAAEQQQQQQPQQAKQGGKGGQKAAGKAGGKVEEGAGGGKARKRPAEAEAPAAAPAKRGGGGAGAAAASGSKVAKMAKAAPAAAAAAVTPAGGKGAGKGAKGGSKGQPGQPQGSAGKAAKAAKKQR